MDTKNWKRRFSKGFNVKDETPTDKPKLSYRERVAARKAKMTPEEIAERQRKIEAQRSSYEDGGVCKKKKKIAALAKLAKSRK